MSHNVEGLEICLTLQTTFIQEGNSRLSLVSEGTILIAIFDNHM